MAEQWFYTRKGQQMDPISAAELKQLAAEGGLDAEDLVWKEGLPRWIPASTVKGLFPPPPPSAGAIRAQAPSPPGSERALPGEDRKGERPPRRRERASDEDEDVEREDEERPRRRKKRQRGLSAGVWIALIGGICFFVLLGIGAVVWLALSSSGLPAEYSVNLEARTFQARYFTLRAGVPAEITVRSDRLGDVDVLIYDRNNMIVAMDESFGPNSLVVFLPRETGNYKVEVRNLGPDFNNSHVKIRELPPGQVPAVKFKPPPINFPPPPIILQPPPVVNNPGQNKQIVSQIEGSLNLNCAKDQVTGGYCNIHPFNMTAGRTYIIDLESHNFDAFLRLEDQGGKQLMIDDDGGAGFNARLVFTPNQGGVYRIIATSLGPNQIGRYTLKIR